MILQSSHRLFGKSGGCSGFSSIELLVVISIIMLMSVFCIPAILSLKTGNGFSGDVYEIRNILEQARTYAISQNTYVFVGIAEVNAAVNSSAKPQSSATSKVGGRVAIAMAASRNGTRNYELSSLSNWTQNYASGGQLVSLGKLRRFENLHLLDMGTSTVTGNMARIMPTSEESIVANAACISLTPFAYPIGASLSDGQYKFVKVIEFDPIGGAKIVTSNQSVTYPKVLEIGLQPTHGNVIPAIPASFTQGNIAAIQVNGVTGAVTIYRP